jgi:hypothetical protein
VSFGVNVAVITEKPAPTTLAVLPLKETTDVVADEYVNVPGREPVTVGGVTVNGEFPKFFETSLQVENVGVPLPTVIVMVFVPPEE